MGVVWLALDGELEREVALKFLPEVVALDPEAVADLKRETRRNLNLTHANIVRIYDFVADHRAAAISMEYVDGATLSALKLDKPARVFTTAEIRSWLGQLTEALTYAHTRGKVVHRDLKPANLMITQEGELKITDFGIARGISDSVSRVSAQAGTSGTPLYMSPQQMLGEKPAVTDDVYSLGAMLYELLTGKPPFYSGNVVLQVQTKSPPSLDERRRELEVTGETVPAHWEQAIAACLAKDSRDRPQSVAELGQRLGLHGSPVVPAMPVAEPERPIALTPSAPPLPVSAVPAAAGPPSLSRRVLALGGSAAMLAGVGTALLFCWLTAGGGQDWNSIWRWVEYPALAAWIVGSLALVRWAYGRHFPWRPWLGMGAAMLAVSIGLSEMIDWLLTNNFNTDTLLQGGPPLMGLALAVAGLVAFRNVRPSNWRMIGLEILLGLGGGLIAALCVWLDPLPAALTSNSLIVVSYPVWVAMGSVVWLALARLLLFHPMPLRSGNAPAVPGSSAAVGKRWLALAGSALLLAGLGVGLILLWVLAGKNFIEQWDAWWRCVEYPVLGVWIVLSLALLRLSAGSDFAKGPWLGCGAALMVADVAFSELMAPALGTPRADDVLLVAPSLLGLVLAAVGLFSFRARRPISLRLVVTSLWVGWGCGVAATAFAELPVLPAALESHLVRISFPVWIVMGSLAWLFLLRLALLQAEPAPPEAEARPSPRHKVLAGFALLPLAGMTIAALMILFGPGT
jgi:hypothetical protein